MAVSNLHKRSNGRVRYDWEVASVGFVENEEAAGMYISGIYDHRRHVGIDDWVVETRPVPVEGKGHKPPEGCALHKAWTFHFVTVKVT